MNDDKYFISAAGIIDISPVTKGHFLNASVKRSVRSVGDAAGLTSFGVHLVEVEPGYETTEFHMHYHEDECVYLLEGTAMARIGDDVFEVSSGDFIGYRKRGMPHSIKNTGSNTLKYLLIGERSSYDICEYPDVGKRLYRDAELHMSLVDVDHVQEI